MNIQRGNFGGDGFILRIIGFLSLENGGVAADTFPERKARGRSDASVRCL